MQPLIPVHVGHEESWTVVYEPKKPKDLPKEQDNWIEQMEAEAELDTMFPTYGAMSSYPNYTAMSCSRSVLEFLPPEEDEEGMVLFVKNNKTKTEPKVSCFDILKCYPLIGFRIKIYLYSLLKKEENGSHYRN